MKKAALSLILALALLSACGKKGPVLAPLVRAPQKAEAVTLAQRGDKILVDWKNPLHNTDGTDIAAKPAVEIWVLEQPKPAVSSVAAAETDKKPVPVPPATPPGAKKPRGRASFEARTGAASPGKLTAKEFESKAKLAAGLGKDDLPGYLKDKDLEASGYSYAYSIAGKKTGASILFFAVRVKDARGRESEFTDPIAIEPRTVSLPPEGLEAKSIEEGVSLAWKAPASNIDGSTPAAVTGYHIYKSTNGGPFARITENPVSKPEYLDLEAASRLPLRYTVRASANAAAPFFESGDSAPCDIVAEDTFPPAAPKGLVPVAGRGFIALTWHSNGEKDLAGYKIRRREEPGTEAVLLTPDAVIENAFQDTTVEPGRKYHYFVTAVDARGNESPAAEIVVDSLKDVTI